MVPPVAAEQEGAGAAAAAVAATRPKREVAADKERARPARVAADEASVRAKREEHGGQARWGLAGTVATPVGRAWT